MGQGQIGVRRRRLPRSELQTAHKKAEKTAAGLSNGKHGLEVSLVICVSLVTCGARVARRANECQVNILGYIDAMTELI